MVSMMKLTIEVKGFNGLRFLIWETIEVKGFNGYNLWSQFSQKQGSMYFQFFFQSIQEVNLYKIVENQEN